MSNYTDEEHAVYERANISEETYRDKTGKHILQRAVRGWVRTKHGYVIVRADRYRARSDSEWRERSALDFAINGRDYRRNFPDKFYSKRYLTTLAKRFAAERASA